MYYLAVIFALYLAAPAWTACMIAPRLAWLTNPTLRTDLAITPQDPAAFLWGKLRSRIYWSFLPGAIAFVVPLGMIWDNLHSRFLSSESAPVTFGFSVIAGLAIVCSVTLLECIVTIKVALTMARRSCEQGRQMNPWTCGAKSIGIAYGVWISWAVGSTFLTQSTNGWDAIPAILAITCIVFAVPIILVRQEWKKFVRVYLDIDPATSASTG